MIVWWIVSLIILIVCIIFAYRMIVSTYEFLPTDKKFFLGFGKQPPSPEAGQHDGLRALNRKVQSVEHNSTFFEMQFSKFQERLKALEEKSSVKFAPNKVSSIGIEDEEEDWKEMYYEENSLKERLENDLDFTRQLLEEMEARLKEAGDNSELIELQIDNEAALNNIQSLENKVDFMQRKLDAASEREKELEQLLLSEITIREKYAILQGEYTKLQSEADEFKRRISELNKKDFDLQIKLVNLGELESKLAISEEERMRLKSNLEELLQQNELFLFGQKTN